MASKNQKEFMKDLKEVYQSPARHIAEYNFLKLDEKWGDRYPMVIKSWQSNWEHLSYYFQYSGEIRRLIYTTNPIEGFHRQVREFITTKAPFTSESDVFKLVYCAIEKISEKLTALFGNPPIIKGEITLSEIILDQWQALPKR